MQDLGRRLAEPPIRWGKCDLAVSYHALEGRCSALQSSLQTLLCPLEGPGCVTGAQRSLQADRILLIIMLQQPTPAGTVESTCLRKSAAGRAYTLREPSARAPRVCCKEVVACLRHSRVSARPMQTSTDCRLADSVTTERLRADDHLVLQRYNLPRTGCTDLPVKICLASTTHCSLHSLMLELMPHLSCRSCSCFSTASQGLHSHTHRAAHLARLAVSSAAYGRRLSA